MHIVLASGTGLTQTNDSEAPHNGRYWRTMSHGERLAYLMGYLDGAAEGAMESMETKQLSDENVRARLKHVVPNQMTFGELEESVSAFYQIPENRILPASVAVRVVAMKFFPVTQDQIDRFVEKMRVQLSQQPK
jgi:hypothetical protein